VNIRRIPPHAAYWANAEVNSNKMEFLHQFPVPKFRVSDIRPLTIKTVSIFRRQVETLNSMEEEVDSMLDSLRPYTDTIQR
jgi:hypothetical protein